MMLFETEIVLSAVEWYAWDKEEYILASGVMACLTAEFAN